ncbi:MAG: hypothetical protein WCP21_07475, partial [Armatimonadota bacterium]
ILWCIAFYASTFVAVLLTRGRPFTVAFVIPTLAASAACAWCTATSVDERPFAAALPPLVAANSAYALVLCAMSRLTTGPLGAALLLPAEGLAIGLVVTYLVVYRARPGRAHDQGI